MHKAVILLLALVSVVPVEAATMYVSDALTVPMRRGPSTGHRIINAGLPAGTPLEIMGEDKAAGFTQVRTANGTEGWVPTQYLTPEPVAKDRLAAATRRIQTLEAELKSLRDNYQETRGARSSAETRSADLDKQTKQLQSELAEVRRVSATSIAQYEENKVLKAENAELKTKTTELSERVQRLERSELLRFFIFGGALVIIGLVIGAVIKSRPKRSTWA
ncbi:MAG TPA: TIGR04211 family SH3 domain-containing protein [Steroidobacteraceae bacterium]|nr:TIGR04211 family SH3 domain-containing protein [Steroidobacteraceae bacterium]